MYKKIGFVGVTVGVGVIVGVVVGVGVKLKSLHPSQVPNGPATIVVDAGPAPSEDVKVQHVPPLKLDLRTGVAPEYPGSVTSNCSVITGELPHSSNTYIAISYI